MTNEEMPVRRDDERPPDWRGGEELAPVIRYLLQSVSRSQQFEVESRQDRRGIRQELVALREEVTTMKDSQLTRRDMLDTLNEWSDQRFDHRLQQAIDRRTSAYVWKALAGLSLTALGALVLAIVSGWL